MIKKNPIVLATGPFIKEAKVCGWQACQAVFAKRRNDIIRVYVQKERLDEATTILKWCAQEKKAYHVVTSEELATVCGSSHHEGIALLAKGKKTPSINELADTKDANILLVALENVGNPHNIGAILRVAAHFGVNTLIAGGSTRAPELNAAICRTAEGGAEHVNYLSTSQLLPDLLKLKSAGFKCIGTSSHSKVTAYDIKATGKLILILGAEDLGLSKEAQDLCQKTILIPGTGTVESLNVACAATALLSEFWRQRS